MPYLFSIGITIQIACFFHMLWQVRLKKPVPAGADKNKLPLFFIAGALSVAAFAIYERDAVLLFGQAVFAVSAPILASRLRGKSV